MVPTGCVYGKHADMRGHSALHVQNQPHGRVRNPTSRVLRECAGTRRQEPAQRGQSQPWPLKCRAVADAGENVTCVDQTSARRFDCPNQVESFGVNHASPGQARPTPQRAGQPDCRSHASEPLSGSALAGIVVCATPRTCPTAHAPTRCRRSRSGVPTSGPATTRGRMTSGILTRPTVRTSSSGVSPN